MLFLEEIIRVSEGGREGRREEGSREGGRKEAGRKEGRKEGGREGRRDCHKCLYFLVAS